MQRDIFLYVPYSQVLVTAKQVSVMKLLLAARLPTLALPTKNGGKESRLPCGGVA